ncbi:MAG: recombinase family protein, partial [Chloroflexota bacterium]|nr:recombinase family protein [Chloroflexota bacterium]
MVETQGAPFQDGPEGQLEELALSLDKELQVGRAQQGSRDGLRRRAEQLRLPPTMGKPYGMKWENNKLVPDECYDNAREIWRMGLEGRTLRASAAEMTRRGIPTRYGRRVWNASAIRAILRNRTYSGVVEALKTEAVAPERRRSPRSYGKTTCVERPDERRILLHGLVTDPIVSEEEYERMQARLVDNQRFAARNTKLRSYLLKGLVRCAHCGRVYTGVTRNGRSYYRCAGGSALPWGAEKCPARRFNADALEEAVFDKCGAFLKGPRGLLEEAQRRRGLKAQTAQSLRRELEDLAREQKEEQATEARAFRLASMGKVSEDVFQQEAERIRLRRRWLQERREKLEADLCHAEGLEQALDSVAGLRLQLERYLKGGTPEDRRFVLEALGANVIARPDATWDLELKVPPPSGPDGQFAITGPGFPAGGLGVSPRYILPLLLQEKGNEGMRYPALQLA